MQMVCVILQDETTQKAPKYLQGCVIKTKRRFKQTSGNVLQEFLQTTQAHSKSWDLFVLIIFSF